MPRSRVLSFISQWAASSTNLHDPAGPPSPSSAAGSSAQAANVTSNPSQFDPAHASSSSSSTTTAVDADSSSAAAAGRYRSDSRPSSRPNSMVQTYQPPVMEVAQDTLPELQRIFTFLNSHTNKLYQEGYFLKLHDLDTRGRPSSDRTWTECFAQLVGTVLSLWDAALLDQAGEDGEVTPTFINLSDASIKMIESLPMNGSNGDTLNNVLSISTAANNRYLLHFNSLNSLTQWTAGIRLSMFENASLQEAYTGSLIAGKGKNLNNIREIMHKTVFRLEDWARVRFGAGTPWRRCYYVISPPDEKEVKKATKAWKKRNPYEKVPQIKGEINFYETSRVKKKTQPIATITDAYAAYAIYPQSKPLIENSTLVKVEGNITIHTHPETRTEGFVFVMPEVHPAVSGFEMMLRFLFPLWDVFHLYGRPNKLVADPIDSRGLMFALPTDRRYGYLEILDVAGLIHTKGSGNWSERQWRKEMKSLTSSRMTNASAADPVPGSRPSSARKKLSRSSLPGSRNGVRFGDEPPVQSNFSSPRRSPAPRSSYDGPDRSETGSQFSPHRRSVSDHINLSPRGYPRDDAHDMYRPNAPDSFQPALQPPPHYDNAVASPSDYDTASEGRASHSPDSEMEAQRNPVPEMEQLAVATPPPGPVAAPPMFSHTPNQRPYVRPHLNSDVRRGQNAMDPATLAQIQDASRGRAGGQAAVGAMATWSTHPSNRQWEGNGSTDSLTETNYNGLAPPMQQRQQSASPRYRQPPAARLPTIPASPYIDQNAAQPSPKEYFEPSAPAVPEHGETPSPMRHPRAADPHNAQQRPDLNRSGSSFKVGRKPVGGRPGGAPALIRDDASTSSLGSLTNAIADSNAALDKFGNYSSGRPSFEEPSVAGAEQGSFSPDYASTTSASSNKSVDRPRQGVLRSVGTAIATPMEDVTLGDGRYGVGDKAAQSDDACIRIDFGPTYDLNAGFRPGTSGTRPSDRPKSRQLSDVPPGSTSPYEAKNESYFARPEGSSSAASPSADRGHEETASRRNIAWQPRLAAHSTAQHQPRETLSAEDWVKMRAALAAQPVPAVYGPGHARNKSSTEMLKHRSSGSTPPQRSPSGPVDQTSRNLSGEWNHLAHQRQASRELLASSRPGSRPTSSHLNNIFVAGDAGRKTPPPRMSTLLDHPPSSGNVMPNMTPRVDVNRPGAREQEYIARMTGTPMLDLSTPERDAPSSKPVGLVGAIVEREQNREQMKKDLSHSTTVQQAIRQRMMQQTQLQYAEAARNRHSMLISGHASQMDIQRPASMHMPQHPGIGVQFYSQPIVPTMQTVQGIGAQAFENISINTMTPQKTMYGQQAPSIYSQQQSPVPNLLNNASSPYSPAASHQRQHSVAELQQFVRNNPIPYGGAPAQMTNAAGRVGTNATTANQQRLQLPLHLQQEQAQKRQSMVSLPSNDRRRASVGSGMGLLGMGGGMPSPSQEAETPSRPSRYGNQHRRRQSSGYFG